MSDIADNLQVNQPNVINTPSTNWPDPLTDPSNKLHVSVTHGANGEQRNVDLVSTSQQDSLEHHLPEGGTNSCTNCCGSSVPDSFKTSQMKSGDHHTPES